MTSRRVSVSDASGAASRVVSDPYDLEVPLKKCLSLLFLPAAALVAALSFPGAAMAQTPAHRVVAGDTLWAIGVKAGIPWSTLAAYNHLANPDLILVGQVIELPPPGWKVFTYVATQPSVSGSTAQSPPAPVVVNYQPRQTYVSHTFASGGFQACVMLRESTNGAGSSNLYGILPSTWASLGLGGSPYTASRAQQDAAFSELYARDGTSPWAPYDGC